MQVFRGVSAPARQPTVLTIGNFDGVHLGHQALLRSLVTKARALALPAAVLTFEPHPLEYFSPANAPARLTALREKLLLLAANGVDQVNVCRFDAAFAAVSAHDFVRSVLIDGLDVRHLIIGDDFRFGTQRRGDFSLLNIVGRQHGFGVEAMSTLALQGQRISSSAVRSALAAGNLRYAADLLGRPYSIAGRVSPGRKLGRQLGYPTANIPMKHRKPALTGVFVVWVEGLSDHPVPGVANIGVRPTVSKTGRPMLEVHLFDWNRDCYGMHLRVHFLHKLRDEMKFDSFEILTAQIARDAALARDWLANNPLQN